MSTTKTTKKGSRPNREGRDRSPIETKAQLLDVLDVCRMLRVSRSSLDRKRADDPDFPKPIRITPGSSKNEAGLRWSLGQMERYIEKQIERAEQEAI